MSIRAPRTLLLMMIIIELGCVRHARTSPTTASSAPPSAANEHVDSIIRADVASSSPAPSAAARVDDDVNEPRVVLVTIDGVRWQDVFEGADRYLLAMTRKSDITDFSREGLLPRMWSMIPKGVALGYGAPGNTTTTTTTTMTTTTTTCGIVRPRNTTHISLPGYFEIFTGRRTMCMSNVCPRVTYPTVLDATSRAGMSTATISSWEMLDQAATYAHGHGNVFVSAGTTRWPASKRPLDNATLEDLVTQGEKATPYPAPQGQYRPDRYTSRIALEYLRLYKPRVFHVGLGDVDELAHRDDYVGYLGALREADTFLGELASTLTDLGLASSTTVIVTTDHGRASNAFREHGPSFPDSGRAFVIAFGGRVKAQGQACASRDLWLTDIASTMRALVGLPIDASPDVIGKPIEEVTPARSNYYLGGGGGRQRP